MPAGASKLPPCSGEWKTPSDLEPGNEAVELSRHDRERLLAGRHPILPVRRDLRDAGDRLGDLNALCGHFLRRCGALLGDCRDGFDERRDLSNVTSHQLRTLGAPLELAVRSLERRPALLA